MFDVSLYLSIIAVCESTLVLFLLYRKGVLTKDDVLMMLKVFTALIPYSHMDIIKQLINDLTHVFVQRYKLTSKHFDVEEMLKILAKQIQQQQTKQQQEELGD